MTVGDWLSSASLLALALLFAWHVPRDQRRQAVTCWGVVAADWFIYVTSWAPFGLHFALKSIGISILSEDIWPIVDAVAGAMVLAIAYNRIWGAFLWACFAIEVGRHVAYQLVGGDFYQYTHFLDRLFQATVVCFVIIGGRGVGDRVADYYRRIRDGLGAVVAAPAHQAARRRS